MSVPNQTPYNIYTANGLTTVFAYEFYLISASDIQVTINGNEVTSGYTVSGVGNTNGGEVTFLTAPSNGSTVIFERVTPTYRLTDYQDNGDLLADTVNKDFDRLWMAIQRAFIYLGVALARSLFGGGPFNATGYRIENLADPINEQDAATRKYVIANGKTNLARTLRVPESSVDELPTIIARRNALLGWNNFGKPISVFSMTDTADLAVKLASSEIGLGSSLSMHHDKKTVAEHIDDLNRNKLSFHGATIDGLLAFLTYAAASGRECIIDTEVNLTVAVNFDAQFSNIHLRWEAPINSDTQLFNLYNLGPKSILKDMWFQNITAPWVINRWDTDGNWIDNAETIANSVVQTNEEVGYQPTASDKDVWPLLSDTVKNQQICGGPVIHTSRGVSVVNPRGRYIAITFMDCNFCTVSEPSVMGGKHQYGTILFNNTGTTAWGKGNKVIDGEVRYGSTSGVVYMRHKGKSNRIYGTNAYRCGESGFKTYQNEVNGRSARCYGVKWDNLTAEQCYYDGFDLASDYGEAAQRVDDYTLAQFAWNLLPLKHEVTNLTAIGCHGTGAWGDGQGSTYKGLHIQDCYSSGTNFIGRYNIIDDVFSKNNNRKNAAIADLVAQIKVPGQNNKVSRVTIIVDDTAITGGYGLYAPSSMVTDLDTDWCTFPSLPSFSELSNLSLGSYSSTETQVWIDGHPRGAFLTNAIGRLLFELTLGTSGSERGNVYLQPVFNGVFTNGLRVRGENGGMVVMAVPTQGNAAYLDNGTVMFYESSGALKLQFKDSAGVVTTYKLTAG